MPLSLGEREREREAGGGGERAVSLKRQTWGPVI